MCLSLLTGVCMICSYRIQGFCYVEVRLLMFPWEMHQKKNLIHLFLFIYLSIIRGSGGFVLGYNHINHYVGSGFLSRHCFTLWPVEPRLSCAAACQTSKSLVISGCMGAESPDHGSYLCCATEHRLQATGSFLLP